MPPRRCGLASPGIAAQPVALARRRAEKAAARSTPTLLESCWDDVRRTRRGRGRSWLHRTPVAVLGDGHAALRCVPGPSLRDVRADHPRPESPGLLPEALGSKVRDGAEMRA